MNFVRTALSGMTALFITFIFYGCYVSKPLTEDVRISVNTDFPIVLKNEGKSDYLSKHTEADYRKAYVDEFTRQLTYNHIVIDPSAAQFTVTITSLDITESTKPDTIRDEKSKENGKIVDLTLAGLKTSGTIVASATSNTKTWIAEKDKNETLTNNRSLNQVIAGENKDKTTYRETGFDDNEFVNQCVVVGRRAAVRITNEIQRELKK